MILLVVPIVVFKVTGSIVDVVGTILSTISMFVQIPRSASV